MVNLIDYKISDNGPQFVSAEFEQFLISHGIQHGKTAAYNPSANGPVERFNKVLKEGLAVAHAEFIPYLSAVKKIQVNCRSLPHAQQASRRPNSCTVEKFACH